MNVRSIRSICLVIAGLSLLTSVALAQSSPKKPVRRAKHPGFDNSVKAAFFTDLFAENGPLVGDRPANAEAAPPATAIATDGGATGTTKASAGGVFGWSKIISPTTIEDEVKALKLALDKDVTRPSTFAGGGNRKCQTHFSVLAMLFAIIGEYDGDVRWQEHGTAGRDLFARTAGNCKTNTATVFNEVKKRKEELADLVGGNGLTAKGGEAKADWAQVADRSPLMKKLEIIETELKPWLANASDFKANKSGILRDAELLAAIGEVLTREGLEDSGDEDYDGHAKRMRDAARQIVDGVKLDNYDNARKAMGDITQACSECHDDYRG